MSWLGPVASAGSSADYSRTPVLMVHGWFVSDLAGVATWATMKKRLIEDGWPEEYLDTPSFRDVRGCDPEHAAEIAGWVEALLARTGAEKVDILAHSEGALNTLFYLKKMCGVHRVRKLVSLAGAFHGTTVACIAPFSCGAKEMCIPSTPDGWKQNEVLADLLACDETPGDVLYTTIWSPWDEIIVPQEGSILAGAEVIQVQTPFTEHGGILWSDEVYAYVREALLSGGANEDGPGWECLPACAPPPPGPSPDLSDLANSLAEEHTGLPDPVPERPQDILGHHDLGVLEDRDAAEAEDAAHPRPAWDRGDLGRRAPPSLGGCQAARDTRRPFPWWFAILVALRASKHLPDQSAGRRMRRNVTKNGTAVLPPVAPCMGRRSS